MNAPPVQYVTTSDGYSIAYCSVGTGRPLVAAPWPHSHLQLNWTEAGEQLLLTRALTEKYRQVQYDARGQGLSTRDLPEDVTVADFVLDMEAVVDQIGLDRFVLFGWGNALGHVAVHYAARHPETVEALILQCSAVRASAWPSAIFVDLPSQSWEYYLHQVARARLAANARVAIPGVPQVDQEALVSHLAQSVKQRDWARTLKAFLEDDATELLKGLKVPTLILHQRDFRPLPATEASKLAAMIPNSRLVLTEGSGLHGDAAQVVAAIDEFLTSLPASEPRRGSAPMALDHLSLREIEVLRLVAAGKINQQIADELVISLNTVNRHVSNIYAKTGAANRAEAVGYAHRNGLAN